MSVKPTFCKRPDDCRYAACDCDPRDDEREGERITFDSWWNQQEYDLPFFYACREAWQTALAEGKRRGRTGETHPAAPPVQGATPRTDAMRHLASMRGRLKHHVSLRDALTLCNDLERELAECERVYEAVLRVNGELRAAVSASGATVAELRYLQISTAPDGQWADQAVHSYVTAILKRSQP